MMANLKKWLEKNKLELFGLVVLLLVASIFRFYNLDKLSFFTYDQARDALYIKRIIVDHKLRLIGTQTSIPGLYTGPAYYYLMAPFLWIFRLNPIGIDVATALFGILTVGLLYWLVKIFGRNRHLALLVALVYAAQPQVVNQSRFAWNPNTMPFFTLLFIWGLFLVRKKHILGWLMTFFSLAILLQLHYSAVCFLPVLLIFVIFYRKQVKFDHWFLSGLLLFFVLMSSLVFFDLRHQFTNIKAILTYLKRGAPGEIPPPPFYPGLFEKLRLLLVEIVFGVKDKLISLGVILLIFFLSALSYLKQKDFRDGIFLTLSCLVFGVLVASFYRGSFFEFYLTFLYPIGFLLIGILASFLFNRSHWWKAGIVLLFLIIFLFNLRKIDIFTEPKRTINDLKLASGVIAEDIKNGQAFNLVGVLGEGRFDYNAVDYRYFLETYYGKKALDWDVLDYQNAKILYLTSEVGKINPLEAGIWEVNLFGPKEIIKTWELPKDVVIYKLGKEK